jgi:hypothetical protein
MSNIRKPNKAARKGKPKVQEMEEVQTVDRRGNVRIKMRPVRHARAVGEVEIPKSCGIGV